MQVVDFIYMKIPFELLQAPENHIAVFLFAHF